MFTIYHNSRCSKSRQTLSLLEEKGVNIEIVDYLNAPPSVSTLKEILQKLNAQPRDILRTGEEAYKALSLSDTTLSDQALLEAINQHPKLLQRPIVIKGDQAIIGRPPENVLPLIEGE